MEEFAPGRNGTEEKGESHTNKEVALGVPSRAGTGCYGAALPGLLVQNRDPRCYI